QPGWDCLQQCLMRSLRLEGFAEGSRLEVAVNLRRDAAGKKDPAAGKEDLGEVAGDASECTDEDFHGVLGDGVALVGRKCYLFGVCVVSIGAVCRRHGPGKAQETIAADHLLGADATIESLDMRPYPVIVVGDRAELDMAAFSRDRDPGVGGMDHCGRTEAG